MLMRVLGMLHARVDGAFVPVVTVFMVTMPVVDVVDMITVSDCDMTAVGTMDVRMIVFGWMILIGMAMRVGYVHAEVSHNSGPRRRNEIPRP